MYMIPGSEAHKNMTLLAEKIGEANQLIAELQGDRIVAVVLTRETALRLGLPESFSVMISAGAVRFETR